MKLIDLYVAEVGRHLPQKQRADIQAELRSALEDAVEDEARAQGRAPDEALAADVLKRYGPPEKIAASYLPPRYLIGPELFPTYLKILGLVSAVVALTQVVAFGAELGASPEMRANLGVALVQGFSRLWTATFVDVAVVTGIFALYESASRRVAIQPKIWDPSMLKEKPERDPDRVNPVELTFDVVASVAWLLIFNLYPQWVGLYTLQNGHWLIVPVLAHAFFQYLPWLNLWWGSQIVLDLIVLAQRRRQPLTHWLGIGLELARLAVFLQIVLGPAIINLDPTALVSLSGATMDAQTISTANEGLNTLVRVGLGVAAAISAVNLVRGVYRRLLRGQVRLAAQ
jgi:hypothetical protein